MKKVSEEHVDFLGNRKERFFYYKEHKCPGWVVGQIHLPVVPRYSSLFLLVQDFSGEFHWIPSNKVSFYSSWDCSIRAMASSFLIRMAKPLVHIYCDGACSGNPGRGGWAAILAVPRSSITKVISGSCDKTTNNRMELTAAIEGLSHLKTECVVKLFSDSTYLCYTMAKNWKRNANQDLWQQLDRLASTHQVTWTWKRRNSTPELSECDRLAKERSI